MVKSINGIFGSMLLSAVALISPSTVSADQIALTFEKHGFTVSGEFLDFNDESYVIITDNGELIVPAAMVTCEGTDCDAPMVVASLAG